MDQQAPAAAAASAAAPAASAQAKAAPAAARARVAAVAPAAAAVSARAPAAAAVAAAAAAPAAAALAAAAGDARTTKLTQNGGVTQRYLWSQEKEEVSVAVLAPPGTAAKSVAVELSDETIKVGLRSDGKFSGGCRWLISGQLFHPA